MEKRGFMHNAQWDVILLTLIMPYMHPALLGLFLRNRVAGPLLSLESLILTF